jgi:UDP:flavonoid glycosyltransferase YjiC (YdhE family)
MARILAYASPARGDLYPITPILTSCAHAVIRSPYGRSRPKVERMGSREFEVEPNPSETRD